MIFLLTEDELSMKKYLNYINVCAVLHNFLLTLNDDGTKFFYEPDGYASDVDADNELNHPINDSQSNDSRRRQLTQYFAEKLL